MNDPEVWQTQSMEAASESSASQSATTPKFPTAGENEAVEQAAEIDIRISHDLMEAYLSLWAEPPEPYPFSLEAILEALKLRGVVEGVLVEEIRKIVDGREYVSDFIVAEGRRPQEGEDGRIEFLFDPSPKPYSHEAEDKVDWHEVSLIQTVEANQPVARKISARSGQPGVTVTGRQIEPRKVRDVRLPAGKGTKVDEKDPNQLLAAVAGSVRLSANQVVVDKVLSIPRDLDFSIGNVDINGGVKIGGNILPGFRVRATGDVHVVGCIEAATIESGGSVWVSQGILGHENKTVVRAAKDVHAKFATNAAIYAGGDISILWEAVNCLLDSGGSISVGSPGGTRGRIVGGQASAATAIRAVDVGAESGTATALTVTAKALPAQNQEVLDLAERIARLRDDHAKIVAEMGKLLQRRMFGESNWSESDAQLLSRLSGIEKQMEEESRELGDRLAAVQKKSETVEDPKVVVRGTLFPGVRIAIGRVVRTFHEELQRVQVVLTDDHASIITLTLAS